MSIKKISIRNLLSYKAIDLELGGNLNIFVGKNGSGKSNFVNALLFALTDKFGSFDRKMIENNLISDEQLPIQVSITLDNANQRLPYSTEEVTIMRQMTTKDEFFLNGKAATVSQFSNLLQCINLSRQNYYNIVRQGKISKISQMRDVEVFELLEEVSGVALYEEKKQETMNNIKQAQQEKEEIVKILNELGAQIKQLHDEKEAFNQLKDIQKQIQLHEVQLSLISAKSFQHQLLDLNTEQSRLHNQLQSLMQQQQDYSNAQFKANKEIELFDQFLNENKQKIQEFEKEEQNMQKQYSDLSNQLNEVRERLNTLKGANKSAIEEEYKTTEQNLDKEMLKIQEQQVKVDKQIQYFQILQTDDPVKCFKDEIQSLTKQLEGYQKEYKNVEFKISQISKDLNQLKQQKQNQINIGEVQSNIKKTEDNLFQLRKKLESTQLDNMELQKTKTHQQQKLCKLQNEQDIECNQLDKQLRDIFTASIIKIMEFAEEKGLIVYGVFAQLMNVKQKRLLPLIETASGPRLFSLIVPDTQTAKQIIDYNKDQQGSVLRIYPLDLIDDRVTPFDAPKDTINLQEQVTLNGDFDKKKSLIAKVIGKWIAVKDYQTALDISSKYEINCITQDNEVVYADSFLTKVGATRVQQSKTISLQKILAMHQEIKLLTKQDQEMEQQMEDDQNKSLEIQREIQNSKNNLNNLLQQLQSQDNSAIEKKQRELDALEQLAKQLDIPIQDTNNRIKDIQQKLKNPKQIKKGLTDEDINTLQQLVKEKQQLSQQITTLMNKKNDIKMRQQKKIDVNKIQQLEQQQIELKQQTDQLNIQLKGKQKFHQEIIQVQNENKKNLAQAIKERDNAKLEKSKIDLKIDSIKNQQTEFEMQAQQCVNQLETIEKDKRMIDAFSELDEQQSKNQIIKKIKELKTKFNHKFTQKDQSLFEKLNEIETRFSDYQQKLQNLKQIQQDFDNLCEIMDKKAESLLQDQLYKRFAEYFRYYFLQIVTTGECQIKLIKGLRKNNKKNWGIDIKVSFKNKEVQNWTSFSSGEKTIVAFVILISLQKCDPAPFYILDEFDAALDDNYRNQVAQIILNLSKESQYIIITFRPELINLNSDLVTFYKVSHHNQQSSVIKTTQQEAKKILKA
ncbi:unnamed protein product [Paramecium primaurelia]|uniref:SMC hinge domain-containing protein n=1 Tax=Paramecium primaurelia TaxID=5886 RepID=A0A8S1MXU8_PARPR|nr:unnamed protein product [Paramecium primaurelia]